MKKSFLYVTAIITIAGSFFIISCGGEKAQTLPPAEIKKDSTQVQASAYHCPMDCENGNSDKPGKCGDCEMDLVERK